ncbi:pilus assembly PilX family protein [Massilia brevitalea]|uniref:pilus assembly PilX family protein n=1 Tax=Massilia brevitalea TaxID=442526 RepID=UPI002739718C|nr:PilX N-terminal domain-containing pilus assembly protein [Massilia brevitalea]
MRKHPIQGERGAALVTVLFLMLAVLMMSVSSTRASLAAVKSARHERDRHVAYQSAQAALVDAERDIAGAAGPASPRTALFVAANASAFVAGCAGTAEHAGLCRLVPAPGIPAWQAADLAGTSSVEYGRFTGAAMPTGAGLLPARPPRYIVELLDYPAADPVYRITAVGFGAGEATRVVLQGHYRRATATTPARRLGWREIANWPELHAATL